MTWKKIYHPFYRQISFSSDSGFQMGCELISISKLSKSLFSVLTDISNFLSCCHIFVLFYCPITLTSTSNIHLCNSLDLSLNLPMSKLFWQKKACPHCVTLSNWIRFCKLNKLKLILKFCSAINLKVIFPLQQEEMCFFCATLSFYSTASL